MVATGRKSTRAHGLAATLALSYGMLFGAPVQAQVIEIGDDGQVATYAGPSVFTFEGTAPIAPQVTAPPQPRIVATHQVNRAIEAAAQRQALSPDLLEAVAWRESRFRQTAVSSAGAIGVMQLMPATARDLAVDPHDLDQNVHGGAAYLRRMLNRYDGDLVKALAAYNAGPGAVDRYRGVPPYRETQDYVAAILGRLSQLPTAPNRPPLLINISR
ncbi:MAG: lytic transglycosylase domain-containing protein [Caulobacter sp.]|nr:lytic transglycosylase domain-containing protein [Caulobacter sp.]